MSIINERNLVKFIPVIETYVNGTSGYCIWADGFCEQWGRAISGTNGGWVVIPVVLLKKFKNTDYNISTGHQHRNYQVNTYEHITVYGLTVDGFQMNVYNYIDSIQFWRACGYLAEGFY